MGNLTFEGGLNERDVTVVDPRECIAGSYNFELSTKDSHFRPRLAFDLLDTATNAASIQGIMQLIKNDDSETTLVQAGDTVYQWDGTTFTSKGTVAASSQLRGVPWTLGGYLVITDIAKATVVKQWDGTSFTTLTTGLEPTSLFAKYGLVYLNRVWLFNVKAGTDTPHLLVASAFENPLSYDTAKRNKDSTFTTGNEAFYMTTPDLKPINGVALFFNTLIVSTEGGALWKITGSDSTDFAWSAFYPGSAATGTETIVSIGNDVVYMKQNGGIDSLRAVNTSGDVSADDLSRWIPDTVAGLTDCITVYDQRRQKVYFFAGSNKLLVLFKDMMVLAPDLSPWSVYKTDHTSSFDTNAAAYIRQPGGTDYYVHYGDSTGNVYRLDGTATGDPSSTSINTVRKSRFFGEGDIPNYNPKLNRLRGLVYYRRLADADLLMDFEWGEDYSIPRCTVPLAGPPVGDPANYFNGSAYFGGDFYFNAGFFYADRVSTKGFGAIGRGVGVNITLTVQTTQQFDVMKIVV